MQMKQVMNYHKNNGLLNMIGRTDPMITRKNLSIRQENSQVSVLQHFA